MRLNELKISLDLMGIQYRVKSENSLVILKNNDLVLTADYNSVISTWPYWTIDTNWDGNDLSKHKLIRCHSKTRAERVYTYVYLFCLKYHSNLTR